MVTAPRLRFNRQNSAITRLSVKHYLTLSRPSLHTACEPCQVCGGASIMELFVASIALSQLNSRRKVLLQGSECHTDIIAQPTAVATKASKIIKELDYTLPLYCMFEYHGQLQTLMQYTFRNLYRVCKAVLRWHSSVEYTRELLVLPDGGTVALDWAARYDLPANAHLTDTSPVVILHHGLVGDSQSEYIIHLAAHLLSQGFRVVALVARGCGGLKLTSPEIFAGRRVSDVAHSIQHVKERYPAAKLFLAGFSLGAALSLQYLSENHEEILRRTYASQAHPNDAAYLDSLVAATPLTAALCVSPPWNVTKNTSVIAKVWSKLLATPLKLHYLLHYAYLNETDPERYRQVTLWKLFCCRSLAEVDMLLYPTHHKASGGRYASVAQYYDDISPAHCVHRVVTPTMVLTSRDDPVCVHSNAPSDPESVGPGLVVVNTPYGGHLAYPEGLFPRSISWADRVAVAWFTSFL